MKKIFAIPSKENKVESMDLFKADGNWGVCQYVYDPQNWSSVIKHDLYIIDTEEKISGDCYITNGLEVYRNPCVLDGYINLYRVIASTDKTLGVPLIMDEIKVMLASGKLSQADEVKHLSFFVSEFTASTDSTAKRAAVSKDSSPEELIGSAIQDLQEKRSRIAGLGVIVFKLKDALRKMAEGKPKER